MEIVIVGLGLIGGSLAKALKQNTSHRVLGMDVNDDVLLDACSCGAIDGKAALSDLKSRVDDLDRKIIQLMVQNARMPVKEIAQKINLTSPAVSSRIHRLEQEGVIGGYTGPTSPPACRR